MPMCEHIRLDAASCKVLSLLGEPLLHLVAFERCHLGSPGGSLAACSPHWRRSISRREGRRDLQGPAYRMRVPAPPPHAGGTSIGTADQDNAGWRVHVESVKLQGFRCFGPSGARIPLEPGLTAFIGNNGTGKTAACLALQRMFGITTDERTVRVEDFHVPSSETASPPSRDLLIEVVLAFPELDASTGTSAGVAGFFAHMASDAEGVLKCRLVLRSTWTQDGTVDGSIETTLKAVSTLEEEYTDDQVHALSAADRSRIQFVYVPASRDGARHVTTFLRGRLWRAALWSDKLRTKVTASASKIDEAFHKEEATKAVESAVLQRWQELHGAGTHATPQFHPVEMDVDQILRSAELRFQPDRTSASRSARMLSDGQRSLVHLALTTAALDLEEKVRNGTVAAAFDRDTAMLPALTVLAVEEPENNLSPFYLSRIMQQLLELGGTECVQVLLSSHSASALTRVEPSSVRYFRLSSASSTASVRRITLPDDATDAGTYVRQAVRAHPELYFARFVVLGEGDSEQVVLPAIARAKGVEFDPSFVAMVPLGGRHTEHFWRLLNDLEIPHATLLDLDYGRSGGGRGRVRTAVTNLRNFGVDALSDVTGVDEPADITDTLTPALMNAVIDALERRGVFFSMPLDLDMSMLRAYPDAYRVLTPGQSGPQASDATEAVLGAGGQAAHRTYWTDPASADERQEELRWYRYLFSNRSKPATHLRAISAISPDDLAGRAPRSLAALIEHVCARLDV